MSAKRRDLVLTSSEEEFKMIEKTEIDHYLLEEIQEELTPRLIGNCGHTQQLTGEMVKSLYYLISNYLTQNTTENLSNSVMQSLREIP